MPEVVPPGIWRHYNSVQDHQRWRRELRAALERERERDASGGQRAMNRRASVLGIGCCASMLVVGQPSLYEGL